MPPVKRDGFAGVATSVPYCPKAHGLSIGLPTYAAVAQPISEKNDISEIGCIMSYDQILTLIVVIMAQKNRRDEDEP